MLKYLLILLLISAVCQASFFRLINSKIRNGIQHFEKNLLKKDLTLVKLNWESCGSSRDLAAITSFNVLPNPIHIPGNVTVSFAGSLSQTLTAPIKLKLEIKKKELFWVPIPCVDHVGSCDYDDICKLMSSAICPPELEKYHIPCHCPITGGKYKIPPVPVHIKSFGVPSWLEDGDFRVTATLTNKGREVMCLQVTFTLK
ncbi:hypothetical protein LSH36_14g06038 [Paralvinella palmiformis]|uniref:MD-2-related lipid-recognition domain-containing protein n=1 Tax=Paralvinella palmiformis TaxID=53620 RepID=A0AAD9NIV7_9ANNE|nr:hypothetical protein LSH36_14g06038 [Paralvinella palmiformis]